jgi:hypothetical protein
MGISKQTFHLQATSTVLAVSSTWMHLADLQAANKLLHTTNPRTSG